eukprot:CAMPEP_0180506734 /NCGR_PEP_ID=MMETSP1036_2-20121128/48155_1 /TAXON_ID=632150 /ORGANISM="Azadinium spinosum, Strain 3D9" /LENGTH=76 /DNA_ID=CAMNT_0022516711 /DNA_START=626 /DNA_END=856 /DNA_ORIENTATION=-
MKNADHAQSALSHGEFHTVEGAQIRVLPFVSRRSHEMEETIEEEVAEGDEQEDQVADRPDRGNPPARPPGKWWDEW